MKTSVPPSLHGGAGNRLSEKRNLHAHREAGLCSRAPSCLLSRAPCARKATGRGCETVPEPGPVLAGLGGRAACGAPAAPAAPTMCRQAGCGASAGAPLPPTPVVLRAPPAARQGPRRVRKQPGSVSGSPGGSGFGDGSSERWGRSVRGSAFSLLPGLSLSICRMGVGLAPRLPVPARSKRRAMGTVLSCS